MSNETDKEIAERVLNEIGTFADDPPIFHYAAELAKRLLARVEAQEVAVDGWLLSLKDVNQPQTDSINRLITKAKHAHFVDIRVRINGQWQEFEGDWIKHIHCYSSSPVSPDVAEERTALSDANDLCRSAYQIADRIVDQYGAVYGGTNFAAFRDRLKESLERQHKILCAESARSNSTEDRKPDPTIIKAGYYGDGPQKP